ncbi:hypothetical protein VDGL01_04633 [Verticillium dahliae]
MTAPPASAWHSVLRAVLRPLQSKPQSGVWANALPSQAKPTSSGQGPLLEPGCIMNKTEQDDADQTTARLLIVRVHQASHNILLRSPNAIPSSLSALQANDSGGHSGSAACAYGKSGLPSWSAIIRVDPVSAEASGPKPKPPSAPCLT